MNRSLADSGLLSVQVLGAIYSTELRPKSGPSMAICSNDLDLCAPEADD